MFTSREWRKTERHAYYQRIMGMPSLSYYYVPRSNLISVLGHIRVSHSRVVLSLLASGWISGGGRDEYCREEPSLCTRLLHARGSAVSVPRLGSSTSSEMNIRDAQRITWLLNIKKEGEGGGRDTRGISHFDADECVVVSSRAAIHGRFCISFSRYFPQGC